MATSAAAGPSLDDCLKLLRGDRDEQKLAGLLLATKFCQGDDTESIVKVYQAVGCQFLRRLLMTGMGNVTGNEKSGEDKEVYLRLAVTVLAAFSRVSEIASLPEMIDMVPLVAETVSKMPEHSVAEECFEFFLLIAMASEQGLIKFYEPKVMDALVSNISTLPDESKSLELSTRLLQLLVNKLNVDMFNTETIKGVATMVVSLARLFCVLHNAIKFDALHMLSYLLSLKNLLLYDALRSIPSRLWAAHIRVGITSILQNRIVSSEKLQALLLADCMMSIFGEEWLLQECDVSFQEIMPVDKFVLLVLESARVEIAVLLNELAYFKYDESLKSSTNREESIKQKQRSLAIAFSLLERFIKIISSGAEDEMMKESTIMKAISGLNETIGIVLDFLQDSKDHGLMKGDDLLAAVRIIGSYLAEAPHAGKDKTTKLLGYILSIEGQDESSPFYSVCFMLPMLSQMTSSVEGCRILASFGGYKIVADCLLKLIELDQITDEDTGTIVLACDTIINFLSNRRNLPFEVDTGLVKILRLLPLWAVQSSDLSIIMTASCVCSLILDLTSEEFLLSCSDFDISALEGLSHLFIASLDQKNSDDDRVLLEHKQIIISGVRRWAVKFPIISRIIRQAVNI